MYERYKAELQAIKQAHKCRISARSIAEGIDITPHIASVYSALHEDIQGGEHSTYNLPGGRGSCKSSFISLEIVSGIMKDITGESSAIIFRRYATTLRDSVYSQIQWAIDTLDVSAYWKGNVSPMSFTYIPTGQQIIFRGLDDASKLKGIKPKHGYFRYVWYEEFSELNGPNHVRSVQQSVLRGQGKFTVFRSFNPPISRNNWANTFIEQPDAKAVTLHTNYLDVSAEWLGESFIDEAERLKEINPKAYEHEYLGIPTGSGGEVFENIETRTITETEINNIQYQYGGIDFGFSSDPAVFVRVGYDRKSETVYILNEIYKKHLSNKQLYDAIREKKLDSTGQASFNFFGSTQIYDSKLQVTCDAAEPKSISDLRTLGLNAHPCKKYQGSVMYGIKWLQHRNIVIDKERTPNTYREFSRYEYSTTKDGEFLADVPDKDNHTIDAVRYALDRLINSRLNSA